MPGMRSRGQQKKAEPLGPAFFFRCSGKFLHRGHLPPGKTRKADHAEGDQQAAARSRAGVQRNPEWSPFTPSGLGVGSIRAALRKPIPLFNRMAGAFAAEDARVEEKSVDLKGSGGEQAVLLEILADPRGRRLLQAGEGDVGEEFAVLGFKTEGKEAGGDLALEQQQGFVLFNPGPDHAGLAARREKADALEPQGKGLGC